MMTTNMNCFSGARAHVHTCACPLNVTKGTQLHKRARKTGSTPRAFSSSSHIARCSASNVQQSRNNARVVTHAAQQSTGESSTALAPDMTKTKVLFVCKGNICRSPAAGSVMKRVVQQSGVANDWVIDSCGTGGSGHENWFKQDSKDHWEEHKDKTVDDRMVDALKKRNLDPHSESRPMEPEDFQKFDYIIAMNQGNVEQVHKAGSYWKDEAQKPIPEDWKDKDCFVQIHMMTKYLVKAEYQNEKEVPDPFHGGPENFERVLDLLEDACAGFVAHVDSRKFATES